MPTLADAPIRTLDPGDLPPCLSLAADRDWPREEHKWRLLLDIGTGYGIEDDAGDLVGSAIVTRYGHDVAVISMVLVASRCARQGIGRRLMTHALRHAGTASVQLHATTYGRPLYEKLGFRAVGATVTHLGVFRPAAGDPTVDVSRPALDTDLPAILATDAAAFGADRTQLITRLPAIARQLRVIERDGRITGYAGAWPSVDNVVIGPVIAADMGDAQALIAELATGVDGPVRLDLDARHEALSSWAALRGVAPATRVSAMAYGAPLRGQRERLYIPVMQALG
ncbi:GNAT family N-acetyltransferase [Micromonospora sp. NPDC049679]|uniref:GNAT family N-acetyltransferase n=1 Tax=Micromonospora sp. NPDC049679 TaxID=3155920 RepID=UPI0033E1A0B5